MLSPYPSLDGSDLFSEAEKVIPYIVEEIGSSLGFVSSLVSSEISSPLEEGSFMPRFKGKRGVPQLRQSFKSFVQNFKSFHPAHLPEPGTVLFPVIFRGEKRSYDLHSVSSCSDVILRDHNCAIFRLVWPASPEDPGLLQCLQQSNTVLTTELFPEFFTLNSANCSNLIFLTTDGEERYFSRDIDEGSNSVHSSDSDGELVSDTARDTKPAVSSGLPLTPAAISWDINFGSSHLSADEFPLRGCLPSERRSSAPAAFIAASSAQRPFTQPRSPSFNFGSSEFVQKSASRDHNAAGSLIDRPWARDISKPLVSHVPVQPSAFPPASIPRSLAPGRQDTTASDAAATSSDTASVILLLLRQQQEQQVQQARRDERRDEQQARRDEQHRADMMQMMSVALTAQASPPPSPVRPIAVISTKSDAKLADLGSIVNIRGMFDTPERYNAVFAVEIEHDIPVTNTVHALSHFRATIKAHCRTNTPDLTDAQLKSAMFLHFEMGKSGSSITDFRPKDMPRVDSFSALGKVMGLASRVYSAFFGPHIRFGFERLKSDLDLLVEQFPGSIKISAAIELVDAAIAATRDIFRYDHEAPPLDAWHRGATNAAAMSITADHPMVCDFVRSSLQAGLVATDKVANPKVAPLDDKRRLKPATAGGAGPAKDTSARPVITGKFPCFSWASKTGACGAMAAGSLCLHTKGPFPHVWEQTTTSKEKSAFLGWLKGRE